MRSLLTSKPSEKDVARVKALGGFAARALASVLAATGEFHPETRAQRACFVASLGLSEADQKSLTSEEPGVAAAPEVPEGLSPKIARALLRGAFVAALLEGTDPREEQAAVSVVGKVVLAKKYTVDRNTREAILGLSWIGALRMDPSFVRRAELATLHDQVAADLGDVDAASRRGRRWRSSSRKNCVMLDHSTVGSADVGVIEKFLETKSSRSRRGCS